MGVNMPLVSEPLVEMNLLCSGTMLDGAEIEVMLAKPPDKARPRYTRSRNADTPFKAQVSSIIGCCLTVSLYIYSSLFTTVVVEKAAITNKQKKEKKETINELN